MSTVELVAGVRQVRDQVIDAYTARVIDQAQYREAVTALNKARAVLAGDPPAPEREGAQL